MKDERNFSTKMHVLASVVNVALIIPSIVIAFLGNSFEILIAQIIASCLVSLLYFVFSFMPKKR